MRAKYINPFTDYGFKKIFGEEASKPVLIDFLNTLLPETNQIVDLTFKNTEKLGNIYVDRKSIYDIYELIWVSILFILFCLRIARRYWLI